MILLITVILISIFILNIIIYWVLYKKSKESISKNIFYKLFPIIWTISIIPIPIINSSFLRFYFPTNYSYFGQYWIFFALLGFVFIIIGILFAKKVKDLFKVNMVYGKSPNLIKSGVFKIVRHPTYFSWTIIIFGEGIISDSLISLIVSSLLYILLYIHASVEEKLILIPTFGKEYETYKSKNLHRILPAPLNFILAVVVGLIIYVGFLNFN